MKPRFCLPCAARALLICGIAAGSLACGSTSSNGSGSPPAPQGPFANVAGTWVGTLETANFSTHTVTLTVAQGGNCVDGAWSSSASDWTGAISGYAGADSFSGQISFERLADDGGKCSAVGDIAGTVTDTAIRWKSAGLSAVGSCTGGLPQSLVLTLQRQ